jgi:serine O-acetyltransferase
MYKLFLEDARRWIVPGQINPAAYINIRTLLTLLYRYMPLRAMAWFRFGCWCKRKRIPVLPGYVQRQIYARYGLEISAGADIGGGLYIAHPIGTVISVKRMGQNCSIIAAVTIGMRNEWKFPEIGDEVFIGAGARVLGGIKIGNNAVIGANAVVIHDVAEHMTVVGIPAKAVQSNGIRVEA